eukprot:TRINITY_DN111_c0_g2_i5.p1 TRINITY_DN111_c0_g2~~TRINITY_DN111_c0_g2_i5.p1  ORF type:complete len:801 (-),score=156.66 TRINITY_DN111_c0_g2_i5:2510-4648(-)
MVQQRQRRFQSYAKAITREKEKTGPTESPTNVQTSIVESYLAEEVVEDEGSLEETEVAETLNALATDDTELIVETNSISITPGTQFMVHLTERFHLFIAQKMQTDKVWGGLKIVFSGANVPGEGEHKIMEFIRDYQASSDYSRDCIHCFYGLDADLIMLGMATHEPKFLVLRETQRNGRRDRGHGRHDKFHFLDFGVLREFIASKFEDKKELPWFNLEHLIDDFVLTLFLCGNDFLPALPTLLITEGALDYFFNMYGEILHTMNGFITHHQGGLHFGRLSLFLHQIAQSEQSVLDHRLRLRLRTFSKQPPPPPPALPSPSPLLVQEEPQMIQGKYFNLYNYIDRPASECLNCQEGANMDDLLLGSPDKDIKSDSDQQMLIKISFKEKVKIHTLVIQAPPSLAPNTLKLFVDKAHLSFSDAEDEKARQEVTLDSTSSSEEGAVLTLDFVKFQSVSHLTVFVVDNQGGGDVSSLTKLEIFGEPIKGLNLAHLEKVPRYRRKSRPSRRQGSHRLEMTRRDELLLRPEVQQGGTVNKSEWRQAYYSLKVFDGLHSGQSLDRVLQEYVKGLLWTYHYYYTGCVSWRWYYPYYYAPLASDLAPYLQSHDPQLTWDDAPPPSPFAALLAVIPPSCSHLLPASYRPLMDDPNSPLAHLHRSSRISVDREGCANPWQYLLRVPFPDLDRVEDSLRKISSNTLTSEEERRNMVDTPSLFLPK